MFVMPLPEHKPEREFALTCLGLYLQQYPERASTLAFNHYEDYMNLADDYKQLRADFEALQKENIRLKSQINDRVSPRLPSFLINRGAS